MQLHTPRLPSQRAASTSGSPPPSPRPHYSARRARPRGSRPAPTYQFCSESRLQKMSRESGLGSVSDEWPAAPTAMAAATASTPATPTAARVIGGAILVTPGCMGCRPSTVLTCRFPHARKVRGEGASASGGHRDAGAWPSCGRGKGEECWLCLCLLCCVPLAALPSATPASG